MKEKCVDAKMFTGLVHFMPVRSKIERGPAGSL